MWPKALESRPAREVLARADALLRSYTLRMFGVPESEIATTCARSRPRRDLSELEIITCLRGGEIVDRRPLPRRRRRGGRGGARGDPREPRPLPVQRVGRDERRGGRRPAGRPHARASASRARPACWRRGSPSGRAPPSTSPAASSPTRTRRRSSCSASTQRADRAPRRRLAGGRRGDGDGRDRALRRRRRRRRSPASRGPTEAPRRSRSATSASTPPRRRRAASPGEPVHPRRPRRHPRALGAGRRCTCCAPAAGRRAAALAPSCGGSRGAPVVRLVRLGARRPADSA